MASYTIHDAALDAIADLLTDIRCAIRDGQQDYAVEVAEKAEGLLQKFMLGQIKSHEQIMQGL